MKNVIERNIENKTEERMTVKRSDGRWAIANNDGASPAEQLEKFPVAIARLAAYEDTGLEPEDVERILDKYGRGITLRSEIKERLDIIRDIPTDRLRAIIQRPNPPLTLDELREMDSLDWLWIEILIPTAFRRTKPGYYKMQDDYTDGEALCCGWPGTVFEFEYEDYGKTWLAYRRKPEEGTEK